MLSVGGIVLRTQFALVVLLLSLLQKKQARQQTAIRMDSGRVGEGSDQVIAAVFYEATDDVRTS